MTDAGDVLRARAEDRTAGELSALAAADDGPRPPRWRLSPWAVTTYLLGGQLPDGTVIPPKYVGPRRLVEVVVTTLATDRALLLLGVPGTAKTWMAEHLAAAISGSSSLLVQGTSGTGDDALRYGWNYARLIAEGPTMAALVPSPVMRGMTAGTIVRIEELTRIPSDVQDALITILSEKVLPIPELDTDVLAVKGFNVVATANDRDRGVNDLSSTLRRRFNTVVLPLPADLDDEVASGCAAGGSCWGRKGSRTLRSRATTAVGTASSPHPSCSQASSVRPSPAYGRSTRGWSPSTSPSST